MLVTVFNYMSSEQHTNIYKENLVLNIVQSFIILLEQNKDTLHFKLSNCITNYETKELVLTLSLENMVFGCSSCVRDRHVRLARAVRHISLRSWTRRQKWLWVDCRSIQLVNNLLFIKLCFWNCETHTCLFSEKVCVSAMMAHVAVEHIVSHEGKAGPVPREKGV